MKHRERRPVRGSESASLAWVRRWSAGPDECTRVAGQGGIGVGNFHAVSSKTETVQGRVAWTLIAPVREDRGTPPVQPTYHHTLVLRQVPQSRVRPLLSCRVFAPLARIDAVVRGSPNHGTRSTVTEHARPIPCSWLAGA